MDEFKRGVKVKVAPLSDSLRPHGLYSPWDSPGKNARVGSLSLLQGIFPIQGSNPDLLHWPGGFFTTKDTSQKSQISFAGGN